MTTRNEGLEILIVEDNPNDVQLAIYVIQRYKLANRVEAVRDGAEALDFIFCNGEYSHRSFYSGPRIILLDLKLPKIDGLEVLTAVRANPLTRSIPVIVFTSSREERDIYQSYQQGVNSYVVKPVDFDEFVETMRQIGSYWLRLNIPSEKVEEHDL